MSINNRPKLNRLINQISGLPAVHGDYYRPADRIIDALHAEGFTGDAISQILTTPSILSGLLVSVNTDTTKLDITSGIAIGYDSQITSIVEHNYDGAQLTGTDPVTSNTFPLNNTEGLEPIPRFINVTSNLTAVVTTNVPNSSTGYVKLKFKDIGVFTRNTPTDPTGSRYPFITGDSYELVIDDVTPISGIDVLLSTFTKNGSGDITLSTAVGSRDLTTAVILNSGLTRIPVTAGASINANTVVYISADDSANSRPTVSTITADTQVPAGYAEISILSGGSGFITGSGRVKTTLNTTTSSVGSPVYASATGALTLSVTRFRVGTVATVGTNAVVYFNFTQSDAQLPGGSVYLPGGNAAILNGSVLSGSRTYTLPDRDMTLAATDEYVTAGAAITAGDVVTITGDDATNTRSQVTTISNPTQIPFGIATAGILNGAAGRVLRYGRYVSSIDTTASYIGAPVFSNGSGGLTLTYGKYNVGNVQSLAATGVIFLDFTKELNDINVITVDASSNISADTVVKVTGDSTGNQRIAVATVSASNDNPVGYATHAIASGSAGNVVTFGRVTTTLNATASTVGSSVYVNSSGALTLTKTDFRIGSVVTATTNAVVFFDFTNIQTDTNSVVVTAGIAISAGDVVVISGDDATNSRPQVSKLSSADQLPFGYAVDAISNGVRGVIVRSGRYTTTINGTGATVGSYVYATSTGVLSLTESDYIVGILMTATTNAVVYFDFVNVVVNSDALEITASASINLGVVVTITGDDPTNSRPTAATISSDTQAPLGYATAAITNGARGVIIKYGRVTTTFDASAGTVGAPVYVSSSGTLTLTETSYIVGYVVTNTTNAVIFFNFQGAMSGSGGGGGGGGTSSVGRLEYIEYFRPLATSTNNWTMVKWIPEVNRFIALANSGNMQRIAYSSDGDSWNYSTGVPSDFVPTDVAYFGAMSTLVAVASAGTNRIIRSNDSGDTWTVVTGTNVPNTLILAGIVIQGTKLVVGGMTSSTARILDTTDLSTFTQRVNETGLNTITSPVTFYFEPDLRLYRLLYIAPFSPSYFLTTLTYKEDYTGTQLTVSENTAYTISGTGYSFFFLPFDDGRLTRVFSTPEGDVRFAFSLWGNILSAAAQVPRFFKVKQDLSTITIINSWQLSTNALVSDAYFNTYRVSSPNISTHSAFTATSTIFKFIEVDGIIYIHTTNKLYKTLPNLGPYVVTLATKSLDGANPIFNDLAYSPTLDKFVGVGNNNTFMREVTP